MSKKVQQPTPGRIVMFNWGGGSGPAIVLSAKESSATLMVHSESNGVFKKENVPYSEKGDDCSWAWPEKSDATFEYDDTIKQTVVPVEAPSKPDNLMAKSPSQDSPEAAKARSFDNSLIPAQKAPESKL